MDTYATDQLVLQRIAERRLQADHHRLVALARRVTATGSTARPATRRRLPSALRRWGSCRQSAGATT